MFGTSPEITDRIGITFGILPPNHQQFGNDVWYFPLKPSPDLVSCLVFRHQITTTLNNILGISPLSHQQVGYHVWYFTPNHQQIGYHVLE